MSLDYGSHGPAAEGHLYPSGCLTFGGMSLVLVIISIREL